MTTTVQNHERLLELASVYRGLSRRELAQELGRDASRLLPANGNPKLDYLIRLADVLDWPVNDVADAILHQRNDEGPAAGANGAASSFAELNEAARAAHAAGDYRRMRELAMQMAKYATTPDERALAALREGGGWDGIGRYTAQLDCLRRGLQEEVESPDLQLLLQANLANAYYTVWCLLEARAMSRELIESFGDSVPSTRNARASHAFGHYVLGHASRRLVGREPQKRKLHAEAARVALARAMSLYTDLAEEFDHEPWRGIANTCRAGVIEVETDLGTLPAADALEQIGEGLDLVGDPEDRMVGDWLESYGWWCIFGCNITLRHLSGKELQRHMAILTNKGYEIAERLDNWSMLERLFSLEFIQRQQLNELAGVPVQWMIDNEEVRVIIGTMGRFPSFRSTGWKILETATVAASN
ncbi:MAG: hypothetical protein ACYTGR_20670 [Planctomycetota bacterium]|jgi:hypothetical protein